MKSKGLFSILIVMQLMVLAFYGCDEGKMRTQPSLNSDGTITSLNWGMTVAEVKKELELGGIKTESNESLRVEHFNLWGFDTMVQLDFGTAGLDVSENRLCGIWIVFPDNADIAVLEEKTTELFGTKEAYGRMTNGDIYELTENNRYWHSEKSLNDALSDAGKSAAYPVVADSLMSGREMDSAYFTWWLSTHWLFTATLEDNPRFKAICLFVDGSGELWTMAMNNVSE